MKYHGNYCGPNWSAGLHQQSVVSDIPSTDEFDDTCRSHDAVYALGGDLLAADTAFFKANIGRSGKRSTAAIAVGLQAAVRALDKFIPTTYQNKNEMTKQGNLRGNANKQPKQQERNRGTATVSTVPAAYGYSLRMQPAVITRKGETATVSGSDYASSVRVTNSSLWEPASSVLINPIYFQNASLGSLARMYEKFRIKRGHIQYVPAVPTSTQGQIVMCSSASVKEPFINGSSTTFLSRALSQGNALATPVWKEAVLELPFDNEWYIVDTLIDSDLDDSISQEFQVYATCEATLTAGILIFHYEIEFKDPLFTYHPTLIPNPNGNGLQITARDDSDINAVADAWKINNTTTTLDGGNGSVYRFVFQQTLSTLPTGVGAWSAAFRVVTTNALTQTSEGVQVTNITMSTGTTLYGVLNGTEITMYASYEGAVGGRAGDLISYQTATTLRGTYSFIVAMVRLGNALRITTQ